MSSSRHKKTNYSSDEELPIPPPLNERIGRGLLRLSSTAHTSNETSAPGRGLRALRKAIPQRIPGHEGKPSLLAAANKQVRGVSVIVMLEAITKYIIYITGYCTTTAPKDCCNSPEAASEYTIGRIEL
jgi:hypothetical protein